MIYVICSIAGIVLWALFARLEYKGSGSVISAFFGGLLMMISVAAFCGSVTLSTAIIFGVRP